ncbi:MAG: hypothetical protein ACTHKG_04030, partial [Nocardioides sp.]
MSDRSGLSIFDDPENGNGGNQAADEPTQVIPTARPAAAAPAASSSRPSFPVVRKGGYDTAAVDRQMQALAGERAGLAAGLDDAKARVAALEKEVEALRTQLAENENPT